MPLQTDGREISQIWRAGDSWHFFNWGALLARRVHKRQSQNLGWLRVGFGISRSPASRQKGWMTTNSKFEKQKTASKSHISQPLAGGSLPSWVEGANADGGGRPSSGRLAVAKVVSTLTELQLLSVKQAAQVLGVSQKTLRRLLARGEINCVRVGRSVRIHSSVLETVMLRGTAARDPMGCCAQQARYLRRPRTHKIASDIGD